MLEFIDKFSVYIAAAVIGYLAYTVDGTTQQFEAENKKFVPITRKMLNPTLLEPTENASAANRDPFSVYWDSYIDKSLLENMAVNFDDSSGPQSEDSVIKERLLAILNDDQGNPIALIGENLYEVGSVIGPENITPCWLIESIGEEGVIIVRGNLRKTLTFARDEQQTSSEPDSSGPNNETPEAEE